MFDKLLIQAICHDSKKQKINVKLQKNITPYILTYNKLYLMQYIILLIHHCLNDRTSTTTLSIKRPTPFDCFQNDKKNFKGRIEHTVISVVKAEKILANW